MYINIIILLYKISNEISRNMYKENDWVKKVNFLYYFIVQYKKKEN